MNLIKDTDSENKERDILASLLLLMIVVGLVHK